MEGITPRDLWYALGLAGIFVALLLILSAANALLFEPVRKRRKVAKRLAESSEEYMRRVQIIKARLDEVRSPGLSILRLIFGRERVLRFQKQMLQADIFRTPETLFIIILFLAGIGLLAGLVLLRSFGLGMLIALGLSTLPFLYLKRKKTLKALAVESQMPDAMELLARSLRAGHTLPSAVELLGEEMEHPLGTEMRIAFEEQRFGLSMPEALENIVERVDSRDLRYFVTAVLIQSDTGGNLVEILEKIGQVIRSRLNFKAKIRAFTAQGRLSAIILTVLPVVMFFVMMAIKKEYTFALINTQVGKMLLLGAVFFVAVGAFVMRRFIRAVET